MAEVFVNPDSPVEDRPWITLVLLESKYHRNSYLQLAPLGSSPGTSLCGYYWLLTEVCSVWPVSIECEEACLAAEEFSCHFPGTGTLCSLVD